ncbi:peptidoglycan DD-metalloendopeptidase family protein [Ornithinimicrobium sp. Y1847]|uniref:peptidoglycan DD-metalloendopeptidase family protein n=1 Tax=Ornithinimicrobium sp. Y1847 TaxID=3405419 RepID=UPI003B66EAA8
MSRPTRRSRRLTVAVALTLSGLLVAGPALASDLDDIRSKIREVEKRESQAAKDRQASDQAASALGVELDHTTAQLVEADQRLRETTAAVETARIVLEEAEADLADAEAEARRIDTELAIARANESAIEDVLADNEDEQARSRSTVGAIARDSYKQGGMGSLATTLEILSGETDAVDRMAMARTVLRVQDQQIRALATAEAQAVSEQDRLKGVRSDIAYLLAQAEANVIAKEQATAAAEEAKTALETLEAQQVQDKAALETEKQKVQEELEAEQQRSDDLAAQLEELAGTKHGLKVEEKAELQRIAEEEARRKAEEEARRKAAEEAARRAAAQEAAAKKAAEEEAARQRAAEREAQRQREAAAEAQRRQDEAARQEAERRAAAAQREADAAADREREAQAKAAADQRAREQAASRAQQQERTAAQASSSGFLSYPVNAPSTSEFGNRLHPVLGIWLLHSGLDFGAPCGTPILAAADGVVYGTLYDDSRGNYVVLDHGVQRGVNLTTAYLHLESFAVSSGQSVSRGQVIGYEGTTGTSTGCHLHFETRENGTPVNPRGWL